MVNYYCYFYKILYLIFVTSLFIENEQALSHENPVDENKQEYVNGQGVRFTTQITIPYTSKKICELLQ